MKNPWKRLSKINPQPEDGTRRINYKVFDALIKAKLPTAEMSIVLAIISKTWGFNKTYDAISTGQFIEATGFKSRGIHQAKASLFKKRIIYFEASKTVHRGAPITAYMLNKHYDTWKIQDRLTVHGGAPHARACKLTVHGGAPTIDTNTIEKIYTDKLKTFVGRYISFVEKTYPTKAPHGKNILNDSLEVLYKLIKIDKFDEEYIFNALRWAQKDDFWKSQIYSLAGLRKKSKNGLTKFQNLSNSYDKDKPEEDKPKITVFRIDNCG